ncbi:MAG: MOSC domain-containing protein [Verrucomicrobiota bacterium]
MKILSLFISPAHNYFGHHGQASGTQETLSVNEVECMAGHGLRGDRFFDYKKNYKGQITFFAQEIYERLCLDLSIEDKSPAVFRRNVITSGIDLNSLIGKKFSIQNILFEGMAECSPCYWMDEAFGPGAEKRLQGQGGLRAQILTTGFLKIGSADFQEIG